MKYYIDTEFVEGKQRQPFPINLFRKETKPTIDLISIGIVSEGASLKEIESILSGFTQTALQSGDLTLSQVVRGTINREYYAVSKDFNLKEAWNRYQMKQVSGDARNRYPNGVKEYWLRDNVLKPIFEKWKAELSAKIIRLGLRTLLNNMKFNYRNFKYCIKTIGKTNNQIAKEIEEFIYPDYHKESKDRQKDKRNTTVNWHERGVWVEQKYENPQFCAYYACYDWVVFCQLFGTMMDLPKGFPMYCIDLKQEMERIVQKSWDDVKESTFGHTGIEDIKKHQNYPQQTNEHNALADARWNKQLDDFLKVLNQVYINKPKNK